MNRAIQTIGGLILGLFSPFVIGSIIVAIQGIHIRSFVWSILHRVTFYNSYYQLGIALNIGIFFLFMKKEKAIFFGRGWLVATVLSVLWTLLIEVKAL